MKSHENVVEYLQEDINTLTDAINRDGMIVSVTLLKHWKAQVKALTRALRVLEAAERLDPDTMAWFWSWVEGFDGLVDRPYAENIGTILQAILDAKAEAGT